jgi:hypothetical protein
VDREEIVLVATDYTLKSVQQKHGNIVCVKYLKFLDCNNLPCAPYAPRATADAPNMPAKRTKELPEYVCFHMGNVHIGGG